MRRRDYIAVLAASTSLSGCLQFSNSESGEGGAGDTTGEGGTGDATGESRPADTRWTFNAQAPFIAGPVYANGTVVATSVDRHVYGIDATTGEKQWQVRTETNLDQGLTIVDGIAVAGGNEEQLGVRVADGTVQYRHVDFDWGIRRQVPGDEMVFQCDFTGGVRAVRPQSGTRVWRDVFDHRAYSIDHDGNTVCIGLDLDGLNTGVGFAGYDLKSGEQLWFLERASVDSARVAVSDGACYCSDEILIDSRTGEILKEGESTFTGWPKIADDGVVVTSGLDKLYGYDIKTGERLWTVSHTPSTIHDADDTFWFVDQNTLYRLNVASGELRQTGTIDLPGIGEEGSLWVTDETVFATTTNPTLYALEK